jgi:hypothetical protein
MLNKFFIQVNEAGAMVSQGKIDERVAEGRFLMRFAGNPPALQVVAVEDMGGFILFDDQDHMAAWMETHMRRPETAAPDPAGMGDEIPTDPPPADGVDPED